MAKKDKKESLNKYLERETGYKKCEIKDIKIFKKIKMVTAECDPGSGPKKDCKFLLDDKDTYYGQCIPKNENKPKDL